MTTPRRRIEPLTPPPDRFAEVYTRAQTRRYHRAAAACGITGVFLAGVFGGIALGGPAGVRDSFVTAAGFGDPTTATATADQDPSTTPASGVPSGSVSRGGTKGPTGGSNAGPGKTSATFIRGEILDRSGDPVSGLYVYSGVNTPQGFVPNAKPARTNDAGWYLIDCTGGPLLVTSWPINTRFGAVAGGPYAARFVDTPSCGSTKHHIVSRVEEGAVVQGDVRTDDHCPKAEFTLWLWIEGDRNASVRLSGLHAGERYRISGAPVGSSIVGAMGFTYPVTLASGETDERDVTFTCPYVPPETPDVTETPDPTHTPSTDPTDSPTTDPTPTDPTPSTSGATDGPTPTPRP